QSYPLRIEINADKFCIWILPMSRNQQTGCTSRWVENIHGLICYSELRHQHRNMVRGRVLATTGCFQQFKANLALEKIAEVTTVWRCAYRRFKRWQHPEQCINAE